MPFDIETKDGIVIRNIPDGTPDDVLKARVTKERNTLRADAANEAQAKLAREGASGGQLMQSGIDPTEGQSFLQNAAAGAGKALSGTARGVRQLIAEYVTRDDDEAARLRAESDAHKQLDTPLGQTGGGVVGEIAGHLAAAAAPGAALRTAASATRLAGAAGAADTLAKAGTASILPSTIKGAAIAGGAQGAVQPVGTDDSRLANVAIGAGAGAGGQAVAKVAARIIKPATRPQVTALLDEGVTPTPGQILGGAAQRIEDGLTSVPILGDTIKAAQKRGHESFNAAAINRSLEPIGDKLPKGMVGRDAVAYAETALKEKYDDLLTKMGGDLNAPLSSNALPSVAGQPAKRSLSQELDGIRALGANLPEKEAGQLNRILDNEIIKRFTTSGKASGETVQNIISKLGGMASDFARSENYDVRALGTAVLESKAAVKRMLADVNPNLKKEWDAAQTGWANFKRIQRAASSVGAKDGVFTPAQLQSAVKAGDKSKDKARFATGDALMQDLSEAGKGVLSQTVPDSGTPFRLANMATLGGLGGAATVSPAIPAAAAIAAGAYTAPLAKTMAAILAKRPDMAEPIANGARASGPALSLMMRELLNARE